MRTLVALLGLLVACESALAGYGRGHYGHGGYRHGHYPYGVGVEVVEAIAEPVIPVSSGLVDVRSYVDSYFPGSSYSGYGTYGPAYGGLGYPFEAYGVGYGGLGYFGGLGYGGLGYGGLGYGGLGYGGLGLGGPLLF